MQAVASRVSGCVAAGARALSTGGASRPLRARPLDMPADLRASRVGPKWRAPRVSRRKAAVMRKMALLDGTYGTWDADAQTGWDPAWDPTPMAMVARPPKGKAYERKMGDRIAKIQASLADMDKKIADYKKSRTRKAKKDSVTAMLSKKDPWDSR